MVNKFTYDNTFRIAEGAFDKVAGAVITASDWNAKWRLAIKQANYFDTTFQQIATLMDAWYAEVTTGLNNAGSMLTTANAALAQANNEYTIATAARAQVAADRAAAEAAVTAADGFRQQASSSAGSASNSATVATQKATAASDSATAAGTKALEAEQWATATYSYMNVAVEASGIAEAQATTATQTATDATTAKTAAEAAKLAAETAKTNAASSASAASTSASQASTAAGEAELWATNASTSASQAAASATTAGLAETGAVNSAKNYAQAAVIKDSPISECQSVTDQEGEVSPYRFTIYGKTTQLGTPAPDAPVPFTTITKASLYMSGKNLIDSSAFTLGTGNSNTGALEASTTRCRLTGIPVAPATTYTYSSNDAELSPSVCVYQYRANGTFIKAVSWEPTPYTFTTDAACTSLMLLVKIDDTTPMETWQVDKVQLELGTQATSHVYVDVAAFECVLDSTTTGVPEFSLGDLCGLRDTYTVDLINKRVYTSSQCITRTYNGAAGEAWALSDTLTNTVSFKLAQTHWLGITTTPVICNRFVNKTVIGVDTEGVEHTAGYIYIRINKSRLASADVAGFKTWLAANNVVLMHATGLTSNINIGTPPSAVQALFSSKTPKTQMYLQCTAPVQIKYKATTAGLIESLNDAYYKTTPAAKTYTVNDSANSKLRGITVYGETTQAGTPTPTAPIQLVSASNVGVNVCGKNLIDLSKCYSTSPLATPTYANDVLNVKGKWYALCPVTLAPNTTYYLKTDRRVISSTSTSGDISVYKTATISSPNLIAYFGKINGSFTTTSETLYTILFFSGTDTAGECEFSNVQLELGTTATAYEPYKPAQRVTLNATTTGISGFTLRGIGSVGDTVEVDTKAGTVKLVQRFKEYVATGNEAWNTASGMYYLPYSIALGAMSCYSGGGQLSNWLKLNASGTLGNNEFRISDTLYCKTDFASVDLWKQKLAAEYAAGNPFTVVYQLATPITTDITSSTAGQALLALYSNYPSTTISCDTPVSMTYKADTTNVVDSLATKAELATKADKAQEAWITPTLLNGATGTAYYRKNQFGELALYGTITIGTGSVATILFKMPVNYAPANVALIRAYNNQTGVLLDIAVAVTGDVLLRTTVTTGQSISFSAVIALA